jgi:hypothetical protein
MNAAADCKQEQENMSSFSISSPLGSSVELFEAICSVSASSRAAPNSRRYSDGLLMLLLLLCFSFIDFLCSHTRRA